MSVEQKFSEQLQALPPSDIIFGIEESLVVAKNFVVISFQELGTQKLVAS